MTLTIGMGEDERGKSRGSFSSPFGNIAIESQYHAVELVVVSLRGDAYEP